MNQAELENMTRIWHKLPSTVDGHKVLPGSDKVYRIPIEDRFSSKTDLNNGYEESCNWEGWGVIFPSDIHRHGDYYKSRLIAPKFCFSCGYAAANMTKTKDDKRINPGNYVFFKNDKGIFKVRINDMTYCDPVDGEKVMVKDCFSKIGMAE